MPWEALPGPDGRGPLALHPLVSLYRKTDAAAGRVLPGPLRIVVAIAAPDTGGGLLLDYERELRNVLAAVRAARQDGVSFAARLCQRGAAAVIATETSITDTYATRLLARVYGTLAQASNPDVVAALAEARRQVQAELQASTDWRDTELAGLRAPDITA